MPKLVDHEVRRREITDAVRRVIVDVGFNAVTFQSVAAAAGFSVRLVQYYFGTKEAFLLATHTSVMEDAGARLIRRLNELGTEATPREAIILFLTELLPLDVARREEAIVLGAFNNAAIVGDGITSEESLQAPMALVRIIAQQLTRAADSPFVPADFDPLVDAQLIVAASGGTVQMMLHGQTTSQAAVALMNRLLNRILGPPIDGYSSRPAAR